MDVMDRDQEDAGRVYAVLAARHADFTPAEAAEGSALTPAAALAALDILVAKRRAVVLPGGRCLSDRAAARLQETARRVAAAFHRQNPLKRALPPEALLVPLQKAAAFHDFDAILAWLVAQGTLVREGGGGLRLPEHEVILPPGWRSAQEDIRTVYDAAGLQPPSPDNFQANYPRDVNVRTILGILVESEDLVRLEEGLYLSRKAVEEVKAVLRRLANCSQEITVGSVRDATGSSRKIIIPLLEYLDARQFTRRQGDIRVLAEVPASGCGET